MKSVRLADIFRWILGSVFVFSGIVKCVDPVGTSLFVEKYLIAYSLDVLLPFALPIAITLAVIEFSLGELIYGNVHRITAIATTLFLLFFTVVTLLNATILPIGDCGCFGDAVRLTPVQTLLKNIVLLPMAIYLWVKAKPVRFNLFALFVTVVISLGVSIYSLRHLPIIDFMAYNEGVDLRSAISQRRAVDYVLVCRNSVTGEVREFAADDTAWYDGWEVVDTRDATNSEVSPYADFMVYDAMGVERSGELLQCEGRTIWLCVRSVESLDSKRMRAIEQLLEQTTNSNIVVLTSDNVDDVYDILNLECYAIDSVVLTSIMRADVGVVVLEDGVIVDKLNILDI